MGLFTIVLDFDGGTYVSQVISASAAAALRSWVEELALPMAVGVPSGQASALARAFEAHKREPTALMETLNVWCTTAVVEEKVAVVNIVATVAQPLH